MSKFSKTVSKSFKNFKLFKIYFKTFQKLVKIFIVCLQAFRTSKVFKKCVQKTFSTSKFIESFKPNRNLRSFNFKNLSKTTRHNFPFLQPHFPSPSPLAPRNSSVLNLLVFYFHINFHSHRFVDFTGA